MKTSNMNVCVHSSKATPDILHCCSIEVEDDLHEEDPAVTAARELLEAAENEEDYKVRVACYPASCIST